jgi:hypothetical protein
MTKGRKTIYFFILAGILCAFNLSVAMSSNLSLNSESVEVKPSVGEYVITYPTSSTNLPRGGNFIIEWTTEEGDAFVDINLTFPYSESAPIVIADNTDNDKRCAWTIPWTIPEALAYRIAIYSSYNFNKVGFSPLFHIYPNQTIDIYYPSSLTNSDSWEIGTTHTIKWHYDNVILHVNIELYKGGIFNRTIVSGAPNIPSSSYNWHIPDDLINGTDYQIKVIEATLGADYDISEPFELFISSDGDPNNNDTLLDGDFPVLVVTVIASSAAAVGIISIIFFQKKKHERR